MEKRDYMSLLLIVLISRTVFIFVDAVFYWKQKLPEIENKNILVQNYNIYSDSSHRSWPQEIDNTKNIEIQNSNQKYEELQNDNLQNWLNENNVNLKSVSQWAENLEVLESIYKQNKTKDILKILVDNLINNYQFEKAKSYVWDFNLNNPIIDAKTYLYLYINTISMTDANGINNFENLLDQMKYKSIISIDDYNFYVWLTKLRKHDYDWAILVLKKVENLIYQDFINKTKDALNSFDLQKWSPEYQKHALVSLAAMKNWYFSLAKKLSIDAILQDEKYILPYQILAYSNFVTNNRENAIEYYYELASLDIQNQDKYNFYIWLSYYRFWDHQKSISTLSQLDKNFEYKTDAYRYLILNYQKLWDTENMVKIRQKILWQYDLNASDFKTFYDIVFYQPFSIGEEKNIFKSYKQLSYDYVSMCYNNFGPNNPTCIYWEVWLNIANQTRQYVENSLLYLAENYPQSYIFQALWDYYRYQNLDSKAKTYYLKSISLSENNQQKNTIENILKHNID